MTILRKLKLCNFAQHSDVELELGVGITTIVGSNGVGKSNAMLAILSTLTNDFSGFPGAKPSLIRRNSVGPSYIESTWSLLDGSELRIVRGQRGRGSALFLNGEKQKTIRRETEITAECERLIGFDRKHVFAHHVVQQSRIDAILQEMPSDRIRAFAKLFDADFLLVKSAPLNEEKAYCAGMLENINQETSADIHRQWKEVVRQFAVLMKERWQIESQRPTGEQLANARELLATKRRRAELIDRRQTLTATAARNKKSIADLEFVRGEAAARLEELQKELQTSQQFEQKKSRQQELQRFVDQTNQVCAAYIQDIKVLQAKIDDKPREPNVLDVSESEISALQKRCDELERSLRLHRENKAVCDACGQAIPPVSEEQAAAWQKEYDESLECLKGMREVRRPAWMKYRTAKNFYDRSLSDWTETKEKREQSLSEQRTVVTQMLKELNSIELPENLQDATQVRQLLEHQQTTLSKYDQRLGALSEQQAAGAKELAAVRKELEAIDSISSSEYIAAQQVIAKEDDAAGELMRNAHHRSQLRKERVRLRASYNATKAKESETEQIRNWVGYVNEVAEFLRPVGLPKRVLLSAMQTLTEPMTMILNRLNLPFAVYCNEDLELMARHHDGSEEPAKCLSGGQRACVALSFWLAKLFKLPSGLRLMIIDEPAANLDAEAVAQLTELLSDLSPILRQAGAQIVLSTHHRQMEKCGDYGIVFG